MVQNGKDYTYFSSIFRFKCLIHLLKKVRKKIDTKTELDLVRKEIYQKYNILKKYNILEKSTLFPRKMNNIVNHLLLFLDTDFWNVVNG